MLGKLLTTAAAASILGIYGSTHNVEATLLALFGCVCVFFIRGDRGEP